MRMYYDCIGKRVFDYLPLTFHIKEGLTDKEFQKFQEKFLELKSLNEDPEESKTCRKNIWIVKPGENTNRGCGINVCNTLERI
jgi:tubulin--tyrosine ligase